MTLQVPAYVAETGAQARADTEEGVLRDRENLRQMARNIADQEAVARLSRVHQISFEDQIQRKGLGAYPGPLLFGSPEEVGDRLQEYQEELGITGVSMAVNPGGISYDRIVSSLRLLGEKVIPRFK